MRFTSHVALRAALACSLALLVPSCRGAFSNRAKIHTGPTTQLAPQIVQPQGGRLSYFESGSPLSGLEIIVPKGAFDTSRTFSVSYSSIEGHSLGPRFNPLTPLITITNGGGYSREVMMLQIPVRVPRGHFAMAFLYDANSGNLEGLPLKELDSDHVTILTRHFGFVDGAAPGRGQEAQIVVSTIDERELAGSVRSSFQPGVDDLQVPDLGTIVQPKGNASGFSIGTVWYFNARRAQGPLNARLDNDGAHPTPWLWADDASALKLVTMLQEEWDWSGGKYQLDTTSQVNNRITAMCFAYSMLLSGEPQLLLESGRDRSGQRRSHVGVVYGVDGEVLLIADPRRVEDPWSIIAPAHGDTLTLSEDPAPRDVFAPRHVFLESDERDADRAFVYLGTSAIANWTAIEANWRSVEDGTIGAGIFPAYRIMMLNERKDYVTLTDGMSVSSPLQVHVLGEGFPAHFTVFDTNGRVVSEEPEINLVPREIRLPAGEHKLGFCISDEGQNPTAIHRWVGFDWIRVRVGDLLPYFAKRHRAVPPEGGTRRR